MEQRATFNFAYSEGKLSTVTTEGTPINQEISYTWTDNNVTKMIVRTTSGSYLYGITYEYDDKKNINTAFRGYYYSYGPGVISENNVILSTHIDENGVSSTISTFTYIYNDNNYPISVTKVQNEAGEEPETEHTTLKYECH